MKVLEKLSKKFGNNEIQNPECVVTTWTDEEFDLVFEESDLSEIDLNDLIP